VTDKHLPTPMHRRRFVQSVSKFKTTRTHKANRKHEKDVVVKSLPKPHQQFKKSRGIDMYTKAHFRDQPAHLSVPQRTRLTRSAWEELPTAEKAFYEGVADNETRQFIGQASEVFTESVDRHAVGRRLRGRVGSDCHRAMANAIEAMQNDELWEAGTRLHCLESALKPSLVSTNSQASMRLECAKLFEFDQFALANPAGKMELDPVCHMRCAGLCKKDPHFERIHGMSQRIYRSVKRKKLQLPALVKVAVDLAPAPPVVERHFLSRVIGKCEVLWLVRAELATPTAFTVSSGSGADIITTSNLVFRRVAKRGFLGADADGAGVGGALDKLGVTCYSVAPVEGANRHEVEVAQLEFEAQAHAEEVPIHDVGFLPFGLGAVK
ncbi:unnamed protein product, partial [Prorocentrum cordatum]